VEEVSRLAGMESELRLVTFGKIRCKLWDWIYDVGVPVGEVIGMLCH